MENINLFEYAARHKLRFEYKGNLSVEDLWDLSVEELDEIFKRLNALVRNANVDSLLETEKISVEDEVRLSLLHSIVSTKLEEANERKVRIEKAARRREILEALATKQRESLHNATEDELYRMLDDLDD